MNNPTISRFKSATTTARPDFVLTAPVLQDSADYDFCTVLQTVAEHRTESKESAYYSFATWSEGHSSWSHEGNTCLTLEYREEAAPQVRATLQAAGVAFYEIQTSVKRGDGVMFALPLSTPFNHTDTTRAASILAHTIGVKGLIKNSYLSTYFFRFRDGAQVTFTSGDLIGEELLDNAHGVFVRISDWVAV